MIEADITIKNYRCFADQHPVKFSFRRGMTAIVGPNNAGKSTVLRFFFEFRRLFALLGERPGIQNAIRTQGHFDLTGVEDAYQIYSKFNSRDISLEIEVLTFPVEAAAKADKVPKRLRITIPRKGTQYRVSLPDFEGRVLDNYGPTNDSPFSCLAINGVLVADVSPYVSLFKAMSRTLYIGPFRNIVNAGSNDNYYDIEVGQSFINRWRSIKTGKQGKLNEQAYQITRDIARIFGYKELEINADDSSSTLKMLIDGRSYRLDELGAGMAHFVIVLINAAIRGQDFILIDEPELGLHCSLQLDFLTTLASYATEGVVFATHNYGLARSAGNYVYTARAHSDGASELRPFEDTPRLSEFLGAMGFSGYRDLGFKTVLLVEGRHDIQALQQLLRLYGKDHDVVLLSLDGTRLINGSDESGRELAEITRLSPKVFALIDSEREGESEALDSNRVAFIEMCAKLDIHTHVLGRRALENYFPKRAISAALSEEMEELGPFTSLARTPKPWSKQDNWRIARQVTRGEIDQSDLGKFLEKLPKA